MTHWEIRYNLVDWKGNPYKPNGYALIKYTLLTEEETKRMYTEGTAYHWEPVFMQIKSEIESGI